MTARFSVGALALALAVAARPALAQDDAPDAGPQPVVVTIAGPCAITLDRRASDCAGVAYMAFPGTHRIDFAVIDADAGWAFSGEEDDNDMGQYSLTVDSIISPATGRMEAEGECDMEVAEDGRTVRSIDCQAQTDAGTLILQASGVIAASAAGDQDYDSDDDADGGGTAG